MRDKPVCEQKQGKRLAGSLSYLELDSQDVAIAAAEASRSQIWVQAVSALRGMGGLAGGGCLIPYRDFSIPISRCLANADHRLADSTFPSCAPCFENSSGPGGILEMLK